MTTLPSPCIASFVLVKDSEATTGTNVTLLGYSVIDPQHLFSLRHSVSSRCRRAVSVVIVEFSKVERNYYLATVYLLAKCIIFFVKY
eukprot:scaffold295943_cov49-Attheya_sp.AAC.3